MNISNFKYYFNNDYIRIYKQLFPDTRSKKEAEFLTKFINSKESAILDFGCAWGRHLKALAQMGYTNLSGVDFSDKLIVKAKENLKSFHFVQFTVSDFVSFDSERKFDFIYHTFQSFGHEDRSYDQKTINRAAALLTDNGVYFLDLRSPIKLLKNENLDFPHSVLVDSFYDKEKKREKFVYYFDGQQAEIEFNVYDRKEIEDMFKEAGLNVINVYGGFNGEPFTDNSERLILVASNQS